MISLPSRCLSDFIRYYVLTRLDCVQTHVPATTAPILVVFHSGGTRLCDPPQKDLLPAAFLSGPSLSPRRSMALPNTRVISVLFRPGQIQRFFHVDVRELAGQQIALADVIGREADRFLETLRETSQPAELIAGTEQFLLNLARKKEARHRTGLLHIPDGLIYRPLPAISRMLGVGSRQIQRTFPMQYGLTLRDFRRVIRYERSLAEILIGNVPAGTLARLAQSAGYFDQAHFDHEFRVFSGYSPSQFCSLMRGAAPELWPFRVDTRQLR